MPADARTERSFLPETRVKNGGNGKDKRTLKHWSRVYDDHRENLAEVEGFQEHLLYYRRSGQHQFNMCHDNA